jgi:hypothetical protein
MTKEERNKLMSECIESGSKITPEERLDNVRELAEFFNDPKFDRYYEMVKQMYNRDKRFI